MTTAERIADAIVAHFHGASRVEMAERLSEALKAVRPKGLEGEVAAKWYVRQLADASARRRAEVDQAMRDVAPRGAA